MFYPLGIIDQKSGVSRCTGYAWVHVACHNFLHSRFWHPDANVLPPAAVPVLLLDIQDEPQRPNPEGLNTVVQIKGSWNPLSTWIPSHQSVVWATNAITPFPGWEFSLPIVDDSSSEHQKEF